MIIKLLLMSCLLAHAQSPQYPQELTFTQEDVTVRIIGQETVPIGQRMFPLLHSARKLDADTAIIDIFYWYESPYLKGADGTPTKLLLSVRSTCPVLPGFDSGCDTVTREGLTLYSIEFVRVKLLKTVKDIDHIKARP